MSNENISTVDSDFVSSKDSTENLIYHYGGFGLITCVNIPGNLLVITTFSRHDELRKPANFFIIGLTLSDLCQGFVYPLYVVSHIHNLNIEKELGNWSVCDGIMIVLCSLLFCSSFHLLAITITRYLAVIKPLHYKIYITKTVAVRCVIGIWALAILTSLLIYYNSKPIKDYEHECMYEKMFGVKRISLLFALALGIPLITMILLYIRIARVARQHVKTMKDEKICKIRNSGREWKATITVAVLLGVFAGLWTPMITYFYADYFCNGCLESTFVRATIRILVYMSTAVNVFIYSLRMDCFRNAVKKDLKKFRSKCRRQSNTDSLKSEDQRFIIPSVSTNEIDEPGGASSVLADKFIHM